MATANGSKTPLTREQLDEHILQFLQNGGKITKVASGFSAFGDKPISKHIKISKK